MKIQQVQYNNNVMFKGLFSGKNNTNPVNITEQHDTFEKEASAAQEVPTKKSFLSKLKNPIKTATEQLLEYNKAKEHEYNLELLEHGWTNSRKIRDRVLEGKFDIVKYFGHNIPNIFLESDRRDVMEYFIKQQLTEDSERKLPMHKYSPKEMQAVMVYLGGYPEVLGEILLAKDINGELPIHKLLQADYTKEALDNIFIFDSHASNRLNDPIKVTMFEARDANGMRPIDWLLNYNVINRKDIFHPFSDTILSGIGHDKRGIIEESGKFEPFIPVKELERKKVIDSLCQQNSPDLEGVLNVLNHSDIKQTAGLDLNLNEHFTADMVEFLTNIATPEERAKILPKLYQMKNLDYDKVTTNGIPALELIFNAEDENLLDIVKNKHFEYRPELDFAFNNIQDEKIKNLAKNIKIDFKDLETSLWFHSKKMLEMAKHQFDSPLYNKEYNGAILGKYNWNSGSLFGIWRDFEKYIKFH